MLGVSGTAAPEAPAGLASSRGEGKTRLVLVEFPAAHLRATSGAQQSPGGRLASLLRPGPLAGDSFQLERAINNVGA